MFYLYEILSVLVFQRMRKVVSYKVDLSFWFCVPGSILICCGGARPAAAYAPLPAAVDGGARFLGKRSTKSITCSLGNILDVYRG